MNRKLLALNLWGISVYFLALSLISVTFGIIQFPHKTHFVYLSGAFAVFLSGIFFLCLRDSISYASKNFDRFKWITWILCGAVYAGLLILHYPGFISSDDITNFNIIGLGQPTAWQSLSYSFIGLSTKLLFHNLGSIALLNLLGMWLICFLLLTTIPRKQRAEFYFLGLARTLTVLFLPISQSIFLFVSRDSLYTTLLVGLICYLISRRIKNEPGNLNGKEIFLIATALVLLGDMRQEGKLLICVFFLLSWILKVFERVALKKLFVFTLGGGAIYYILLPYSMGISAYSQAYQLTAYVNPLSEIIRQVEIPQNDLARIDAVISLKSLDKNYSKYDIGPFHNGGMKTFSDKEFSEFKSTARKIFFTHLDLFFKNRFNMFLGTANIRFANPIFDDSLFPAPGSGTAENQEIWPQYKIKIPSFFQTWHFNKLRYDIYTNNPFVRFLLSSWLFPMMLLIGMAFYYLKRRPIVAFTSMLLLCRVPVIFLLAPANYYKYYGSIFLGGWLIIILLLNQESHGIMKEGGSPETH